MNWARGLKFAGIHVAIAIPLIASQEIPRWETEKIHSQTHRISIVLAAYQEEPSTVDFTPMCEEWRSQSWEEKLLAASETPALILSGWNSDCPAAWTISGMLGIDLRHRSVAQRLFSSLGLCCLVTVQWLLLGGLPLVEPRRWWLEPGAANTALTIVAIPLSMMGDAIASNVVELTSAAIAFGILAFIALILILFTWLEWLSLIAWRLVLSGWRAASRT